MNFENVVLRKVSDILGNNNSATFDFGTLFVKCAEDQSKLILERLASDYNNRVEMNKSPFEYSYDFT